jgi:uncharacterized protein YkwD
VRILTTPSGSVSRRSRRFAAVLLAAVLAVFAVQLTAAPAAHADTSDEWSFAQLINQARASAGLPPLTVSVAVTSAARSWSAQMASSNTLSHNPNLQSQLGAIAPNWRSIGENVGYGPSVSAINTAFMNSAPHRANILDASYNYVGVGVVIANGVYWVTEDFVGTPDRLTPDTPPQPAGSPVGNLDSVWTVPGGIGVAGWAVDPDTPSSPIDAAIYVDGRGLMVTTANGYRPDVGAAQPTWGSAHGFSGTIALGPGTHSVCAYGLNVGPGSNDLLGACRSITVGANPFGSLDLARTSPNGITVSGWAIDPQTSGPISVAVYVDGVGRAITTASRARGDVGAAFPAWGPSHGYQAPITLGPGAHTVCAYGLNVGAGSNDLLGCRLVGVGANPTGSLDLASGSSGRLTVSGWALDPQTAQPIQVAVYVDGRGVAIPDASSTRWDVAAAFPGWGSPHGYTATMNVGPGLHTVCTYGLNVGAGGNALLGCRLASA